LPIVNADEEDPLPIRRPHRILRKTGQTAHRFETGKIGNPNRGFTIISIKRHLPAVWGYAGGERCDRHGSQVLPMPASIDERELKLRRPLNKPGQEQYSSDAPGSRELYPAFHLHNVIRLPAKRLSFGCEPAFQTRSTVAIVARPSFSAVQIAASAACMRILNLQ